LTVFSTCQKDEDKKKADSNQSNNYTYSEYDYESEENELILLSHLLRHRIIKQQYNILRQIKPPK